MVDMPFDEFSVEPETEVLKEVPSHIEARRLIPPGGLFGAKQRYIDEKRRLEENKRRLEEGREILKGKKIIYEIIFNLFYKSLFLILLPTGT